jgi:hypothetical protein
MRLLARVLTVLALVLSALTTLTPVATSVGSYCANPLGGLTPNVWQGLGTAGPGTTDDWETAGNWSLGVPSGTSAYVCIPSGGLPVIREGQEVQIRAIDVNVGAELQLDRGSKLFLSGNQVTQPSTVRGRIEIRGGTLGGPGRIDLLGSVLWEGLGAFRSATITTRECAYFPGPYRADEETCTPGTPIAGTKGLMEVHDTGSIDIAGGGVNLGDQYQLIVRGLVRVRDGAYVAADHGTRLELRPHSGPTAGAGTLRFEDDGDYIEGKNDFGVNQLSTVINQGRIIKSGGTGISMVSGTYNQPSPGTSTVSSGTLLLPTGSATSAKVAAGRSYGSGSCLVAELANCPIETFDVDRQNARFQVPSADTSGAAVRVRELTTLPAPSQITLPVLGFPVDAHASGLTATAARPAVLTFRYDERLLGGRGWTLVKMYRQATAGAPYVLLKSCLSTGKPPTGQVACVDRRGLAGSSRNVFDAEGPGSSPDVIMVVRTTKTSRWVGR